MIRRILPLTIRGKIIIYSVATIFLLGVSSFFTLLHTREIEENVSRLFESNTFLKEVLSTVEAVDTNLLGYLTSKNSESLREYIHYSSRLRTSALELNTEKTFQAVGLAQKNIASTIGAYLSATDDAVSAKRGRNVDRYTSRFEESRKIAGYLRKRVEKLDGTLFDQNLSAYVGFYSKLKILQLFNTLMLIAGISLNISIVLYMAYRLTAPLMRLTEAANEIASGNFEAGGIPVETKDEVGTVAMAFHAMRISIREYIEQLRDKAVIESRLMEQEIQNLRMRGIVKHAELRALQSQINPHFLFNTLNAGVQLSLIEDAERTRTFLENFAGLLRHNMKRVDRLIPLGQEIESLKNYTFLVSIRFPDRYRFIFDVDESTYALPIPPLILQPLVENSIIHGFQDCEEGGEIRVSVKNGPESIMITVEDNGAGMDEALILQTLTEEDISAIFDEAENGEDDSKEKDAHGIGLRNVLSRIQLFYNRTDCVTISSETGSGTAICLSLPKTGGRKL